MQPSHGAGDGLMGFSITGQIKNLLTKFMNGFKSSLFSVSTSDGRNFTLANEVQFQSATGLYRMPVGAQSDGASTPRECWSLLPPFGTYWPAAYLHDAAYRGTLEIYTETGWEKAELDKPACDNLLLEAMETLGVDDLTCRTIYEAVKLAGRQAFNEDRDEPIQ